MRAWPTTEGGHLVVATDFMLGGGLVNMAESLCEAVAREFGGPVTVVRHFPARTMLAHERDRFDLLVLNTEGIAETHPCTQEILHLLGPSVLGFPGDTQPVPADGEAGELEPQSVHMARLQAAALRLKQSGHGTIVGRDLDSASRFGLSASVLERLADFLANALVDNEATEPGGEREQKLDTIVAALKSHVWELVAMSDELESEARKRG
ncbi:hypothetical protein [Streptomyces antarcticus]|uniref:hypothetical protein n=1 Tax=Streptomyces antarcticus TaxID=2996458 RepID=UPI00226DCB32|nr:hypothetical protein [Streptomyces sp. H34-AA3]MCY0945677.1 hypothetical protein [Streptomyces sp. H34-AA3]